MNQQQQEQREVSIQRQTCERAKELMIEGIVAAKTKHWRISGAQFRDPGVELILTNTADAKTTHRVRVTIDYLDGKPVGSRGRL